MVLNFIMIVRVALLLLVITRVTNKSIIYSNTGENK